MHNNRGFTLIELIIAMALFIVVIIISASAFESILKTSGKLVASEESNIEGVVGLEMLRYDLQQMGYGLPSAFRTIPTYLEAVSGPSSLNDSTSNVPRAVVSFENYSSYGDYVAIKASSVGSIKPSQKWTYAAYTSPTGVKPPKVWSNSAENLVTDDNIVILNRTFSKVGTLVNTMTNDSATDWATFKVGSTVPVPLGASEIYYHYGIAHDITLRMPFNRVDYYVKRPGSTSIPGRCKNNNTGILYKALVNHSNGDLTEYPLVDCVADMQVVFGWDLDGTGVITESSAYHTNSANISVSGTTATASEIQAIMQSADEIRNKLKYVKVYIMAQEGNLDMNYKSPKVVVGDLESLTRGYDVAALTLNGWLNYRWKVYRLVVKPKNLVGN